MKFTARLIALTVVALAGFDGVAQAQARGQCVAPSTLMLVWFQAPDNATALRAREQTHEQVRDATNSKELCVMPIGASGQMDIMLKNSGYRTDVVLTTTEALQLARPLSVDEVFQGVVEASGSNVVMSGTFYLARDERGTLRELVPKTAPGSIAQGAKIVAQRIAQIRKELPAEKRCYAARRADKPDEAVAAAREAIAAYPDGVLGRLCLAAAMQQQKKSSDEVLAVVKEVTDRDPTNVRALQIAAEEYYNKGDKPAFANVTGRLMSLDPTNSDAVENYVTRLAGWKLTEDALRALDIVLKADPENYNLRRIEFRLIYSAERYKDAAQKGEELARADTAAVDTLFIQRMMSAYANDKQQDKVLEWIQVGTKKFPTVASFTIGLAQVYASRNQLPDAIAAYRKLMAIEPENADVRVLIANAFVDLGQPDSAMAYLRLASTHGDDKAKIAGVALSIGGKFFQTAQQAKSTDDYRRAVPFIAFSDSTDAGDGLAKFLYAYSAYSIGSALASALEQNPSCEMAREAKTWIDLVRPLISSGGGRAKPTESVTIMNALNGDGSPGTYVDRWMAAHRCQ